MEDNPVIKKRTNWWKISAVLFGIFLVFSFGYGLGSGNLEFGSSATSQNNELPSNLNFSSLQKVYSILKKNFDGDLEEQKLLDGAKKGLVAATGDPHTEYLTAEQYKEFNEVQSGTFTGIGAELGKNDKNFVTVISPIEGYPASKAGLKSNDVIYKVDGKDAAEWSVEEAVKNIRGEAGTEVKLTIIRDQKEELDFTITRAAINIPSVESKVLHDNIGYIKITHFGDDTVELARKVANELKKSGVKSVILDMRGNPGGYLNGAVDVSSLWLPNGKTVLQEKRAGVVIKDYTASGETPLEGVPTIVLIDGGSASASEITAGALKDNGAAKLLGEKSYGKGSVQTVEVLPDGSAIKITIARWFTPGGRNIDKEGIEPDIKIEQKNDSKNDQQLEAAMSELKK